MSIQMRDYFYSFVDELTASLTGGEALLAGCDGEDSDFVRFNESRVRQAGSVTQCSMSLELIDQQRHASATIPLSGQRQIDRAALVETLDKLRSLLPSLPEDPYLLYATGVTSSDQTGPDSLPEGDYAVRAVLDAAKGRDLVGIYAAGEVFSGFANSLGQRNWFATHSFHMDWCFYHQRDKAVKTSYAGFEWSGAQFAAKVDAAAEQLGILSREPKTVEPGGYRVYLSPPAVAEIAGLLCWGGFGLKSHRTKNTPLLKMIESGATLSPLITLRENTREGLAANFQGTGFIKPDQVTLIEAGKCKDCLISPRSAMEYGVQPNGASGGEYPSSLDMAAGDIASADILARLGTGVYINTLWYLNYSDRPAGRMTGMTRFATFWVEDGQIAAPLNVMRFDETVYRILGANLLGLTAARDFLPSNETYDARSTDSIRLPGALIDDFQFTL